MIISLICTVFQGNLDLSYFRAKKTTREGSITKFFFLIQILKNIRQGPFSEAGGDANQLIFFTWSDSNQC